MEVKTIDGEKVKLLELFGGMGACTKALKKLGISFEVVDYVEIDKYAVRSYNAINNTNFKPQDISNWNKDIEVDLIMHGSPCTSISLAGKQKGADEGTGTASSLMYETLRIVDKLKPSCVIWENVANILSEKHKHNFEKYLETMEELGYNNYHQVLNAKDYGIPQNRERVFTVSIRKDIDHKQFYFPEKQPLHIRLKDLLETNVDEKYYLSDEKISSISHWKAYQKPFENVLGQNSVAPTLTARGTGEEHAGMITYSDELDNTTNIQEQLLNIEENNGIVTAIVGDDQDIDNPLKGISGQSWLFEQNVYSEDSKCIRTFKAGEGSGNIPKIIEHTYTSNEGIEPTLTSSMSIGSENVPMHNIGLRIRKLTPKECWRLMGFDDEDFEKAAQVNSNAQLYKQAGNSIVVNVLQKIFINLFNKNDKECEYRVYRQHKIIDYIMRGLLQNKEIDSNGNANVDFWTPNCSFFLTIENYKKFESILSSDKFKKGSVNQSVIKLLEIALIKATEYEFTTKTAKKIDIDISEIMQLLNKNSEPKSKQQQLKDYLKKQIREDLQIIKNIKIKFRIKTGEYVEIPLCKNTTILEKDTLHFVLNDTLNNLLNEEGINIVLPLEILQFNEKYTPNFYLIYRKIISEIGIDNEAKINVNELYRYCVTIPRLEAVKKINGAYSERIRMPVEKVLNSISEIEWKYESKKPQTFKEWLNTNIIFTKNQLLNETKAS